MKKQKRQKIDKKSGTTEPSFEARTKNPEDRAPPSILDLAASFWDSERSYPTERRA